MELGTVNGSAQTQTQTAMTPAKVSVEDATAATISAAPSKQSPVQTVNAITQTANIPNMEQVRQAAHSIADSLKLSARNLEFTVDDDTGSIVIKVVDPETKEVIRQIPPEELLKLARAMNTNTSTGKLIEATA